MKPEDSPAKTPEPLATPWWGEPTPLVAAHASLRFFMQWIDALRATRRKPCGASSTRQAKPDQQHHA